MAKKGDWVQIHNIVLTPEERSSALPEDTKSHPLEMWVKGYLQQDEAQVGDEVEVITRTGRHATGKLVNEAPYLSIISAFCSRSSQNRRYGSRNHFRR